MTAIDGYIELLQLCNSHTYDPFLADMQRRCLEALYELLSDDNYISKYMSSDTEERYNHNHDPHTGRFTSGNGVDNGGESGIINTGAVSGALNPMSKQAEQHAVLYYESVRHMKTDTLKISKSTGISKEKLDKIKNHVFVNEHELLDGKRRFDPDYEIAQSWQRLINGDYKEQDIVLLKHEYAELRYMEKGFSQNEAHIKASRKYNFAKYVE